MPKKSVSVRVVLLGFATASALTFSACSSSSPKQAAEPAEPAEVGISQKKDQEQKVPVNPAATPSPSRPKLAIEAKPLPSPTPALGQSPEPRVRVAPKGTVPLPEAGSAPSGPATKERPAPSVSVRPKGVEQPQKRSPQEPSGSAPAPRETYSATEAQKPLPKALQEVETKYAEGQTLFAEFRQVNETASTGSKKESKGIIYAKRPDKVRWETRTPDPNLLVSDGKKFWFYTPPFDEGERGQLIERRASEVQTKLANALLSGSFSIVRDMKIEEKSPSQFVIHPPKGTAGTIRRAEIAINRKKGVIQTVILEHEGGNRSEIQLEQIELGRKMGEELFVFVAPPNTDRVSP